jgi:hypothetical protein
MHDLVRWGEALTQKVGHVRDDKIAQLDENSYPSKPWNSRRIAIPLGGIRASTR